MRCKSMFRNLVHSFSADLHFHPFVVRTEDGNMQALISVSLWYRQPIAQSFWVWLIHICNYRIYLPALHLLFFQRRIEYYPDGKKVIYTRKATFLLLHFLPYWVYRLCPGFDMIFQSGIFQCIVYWLYERFYVLVTRLFRLVKTSLYIIVGIMLKVFQWQIFEFAFQLIQSELMGEGGIQVAGFFCHLVLCFNVFCVADLSHDAYTVCNHYKDYAHIFGKCKKQVPEVLAFYCRTLCI